MTRNARKFVVTVRITFGRLARAGAGFLALAIVGMTSQDSQMVRAAYFAMD